MNTKPIKKIEQLLVAEFKTVPFHNLFMLNNCNIVGTHLGGTCSDKVLHFKKVLAQHGFNAQLHTAFINNIACHRLLRIKIAHKTYFIDVGSGWPSIQLFPAYKAATYTAYGMTFKTVILSEALCLYRTINQTNTTKLMCRIPLTAKKESLVLQAIQNRFANKNIYPFQNSLRFAQIMDDSYYFIRGTTLGIYNATTIQKKELNKAALKSLIQNKFEFDLNNLAFYFP